MFDIRDLCQREMEALAESTSDTVYHAGEGTTSAE
jgi:hypothetical protein